MCIQNCWTTQWFGSLGSSVSHWASLSGTGIDDLGPPDVFGLQLPEAFTTTSAGQGFWELKSKNIWRPKVGDH